MTELRWGDKIDICCVWSGLARGDGKESVQLGDMKASYGALPGEGLR